MAPVHEPVIGLEVHAQLLTRTKLFCACATAFGAEPNSQVCPVCLGMPGALPVPNGGAVDLAIRVGLALGSTVRHRSVFARKNYFYPDLAKGYQISQLELPLNEGGALSLTVDGVERRIGIRRAHIEEDAAKNLHGGQSPADTLVDFNRAGVPLVEIVSEPEIRSPAEAEAFLRRLREVLVFAGVNDGNLEEGSFRCDANVSLRPEGAHELGTRTEIKNINSFRFVRRALEHEISRQEAVLAAGGEVVLETRTWSEESERTVIMRGKEEAHDYRYFPDPDLPPLLITEERIEGVRVAMPEAPDVRRARWVESFGLTDYDATVLTGHPAVADFFDATASALVAGRGSEQARALGKRAANFLQAEVLRHVRTEGRQAHIPTGAEALAALLDLVDTGVINGKIAKDVFAEMVATGLSAAAIVEARGLAQVTDEAALAAEVRRVVEAHPEQAADFRAGKGKLRGFFVGKVMQATQGRANPRLVNSLLDEVLGRSDQGAGGPEDGGAT